MVILTFPCAIHRGRIDKGLLRRGAILICQSRTLYVRKVVSDFATTTPLHDPDMELSDGNIDQHGIAEDFGAGTCK